MIEQLKPILDTLVLLAGLFVIAPLVISISLLDDRIRDWVSRLNPWPKKK